ncbi:hypothetical protein GOE30_24145 [Salmonella enterica]|uniref:Lysozyme n=1 Tax=Salmonella enterica subsp. enterica serovar Bareilly TaxID=58096 RepID=A0A5U9SUX0_SALET|nr:hypothetical protein [Salmonella enterica]EBS4098492.1 hypothetical protein [Salmonella enterica subsp. enterica serovar Bareilly]EDE7122926.1 hypothetical protein [Salmonella enterica subsp. enterica serovar Hvittingfoss]EAM8390674.1 hypothetical protein [Salmonella enterica]EAX1391765.1 lysozyme [Salmonella enterica]EBQ2154118.1 lysozyme [Salmonella enterica]
MKVSINGLNLIKCFEGLKLRAYKCLADTWTIGYGNTIGIEPNTPITKEQAISLLRQDVPNGQK